ncbi:hypothetical protein PTKIN_Ptkin14bG0227400 [Pterospermum kingtungense]
MQLTYLYISDNQLEGSIPDNPNAFSNLSILESSFNLLNGTTPSWLYSHPILHGLDLSNNQLIGRIHEFQHSVLERLDLSNNRLQGSIPSSIEKLVNLSILDLSSNRLKGTINLDMFSNLIYLWIFGLSSNNLSLTFNNSVNYVLPNLQFVYLNSCNITEFPEFLKGSEVLRHLDLSKNRIHGRISKFPWKEIQFLDLHSNFIQGDLPALPLNINFFSVSNNNLNGEISNICNMKSLEILDLSHNNFSGIIPQCIGSFSQSLSSLNLKMNKFHGIIPPTFATGCGLKNLNLNSNHLKGPLTRSISNCKDLEVLDLGNNKINGTFPCWIEALSELQVLVLHSNEFQGSIGATKNPQPPPKLRIIDLSGNNFVGSLPTGYIKNFRGMMTLDEGKAVRYMGDKNQSYDYSIDVVIKGLEIELVKILTIFTSIDLSSNSFEGEIPTTFGELSSLRGLNLSHNNLTGHIPLSLQNLTQLEWLDLSSNKLGGQIPSELFSTFENGSYEGNEGLCGLPLSKNCSSDEEHQPPPWMNSHEDDSSKLEFGWKVVAIGYGFGFIFGVAVGSVALRMGKLKWFLNLLGFR